MRLQNAKAKLGQVILLMMLPINILVAEEAQFNLDVKVEGVNGPLAENVLARLSIERLRKQKSPSKQLVRSAHRKAEQEIKLALQPFGFYQPAILSELEKDKASWKARYQITLGTQTRVSKLDVQILGPGKNDQAILEALKANRIPIGQPLLHSNYERLKSGLYDSAYDRGYIEAKFTRSQLAVTPASDSAEVYLYLDTGPRYFFGPTVIEQEILSKEFVQRYVPFKQGEPFSTKQLLKLKFNLDDTGYFAEVDVQPQYKQKQDNQIPIRVKTTARKPRKYSVGAGFGTDTGPRGRLGVEFRRVGTEGHKITSDLRASAIEQEFLTQYTIPIYNVFQDRLVFFGRASQEDVAEGDGDSTVLAIGANQDVGWHGWRRRTYITLNYDDFSIGNESDTATFLTPGISLTRTQTDKPLFTKKGYRLGFDIHGAQQGLLADTSFLKTSANAAAVYSWSDKGRFLVKTEIGAVSVTALDELPLSERFFAGGDRSVRGYDYESLGDRDSSGENIGGRYLYTGSLETDYLFYKQFGGALFIDAGNAVNEFDIDPEIGTGFGFRWASPVGMLRLDLAWPVNSDEASGVRLHISIGPDL